jgi:glycosyltransferase involved in cell wall biosynthesis
MSFECSQEICHPLFIPTDRTSIVRILYLTEFLSAIGGGGEVMFRDFAVEMARRGHTVDIASHQSKEPLPAMGGLVTVHNVTPPIALKHGDFPSLFHQFSFILKSVVKGAEIIKANRADIIHANTLSPAFAGSILGMLFGIPVINTVHHVYSVKHREYTTRKYRRRLLSKLISFPKLLCEKAIVRLPAAKIVTVSQSSMDDLVGFGVPPGKVTMVPNAVYLDSNLREGLQYENLALFLGRLVDYKNIDIIIKAFVQVVHAIPSARLVIAGDGPEREELERLAAAKGLSDNIVFEGFVSENRKEALLKSCAMLLFPSMIEGFGIVLLEAFARNKPVVVADVRPLTEIVDDNADGFIVGSTSPSEWADKIVLLLKNKSICSEMGAKGRGKVETRFNIAHAAKRLEAIYEEVAAMPCRVVQVQS